MFSYPTSKLVYETNAWNIQNDTVSPIHAFHEGQVSKKNPVTLINVKTFCICQPPDFKKSNRSNKKIWRGTIIG